MHSGTLTFNVWDLFRKAFPDDIDRHTQFRFYEQGESTTVPSQLHSMINRMPKLDVSMLTFFCVRNFALTMDHLIALTKIDTLAVLVLEGGDGPNRRVMKEASASTVRDWGRSVSESGAFQRLRVLIFGDFAIERDTVLAGVSRFPALNLVGILDRYQLTETLDPCRGWCAVSPQS
jgi:hypothetical protein